MTSPKEETYLDSTGKAHSLQILAKEFNIRETTPCMNKAKEWQLKDPIEGLEEYQDFSNLKTGRDTKSPNLTYSRLLTNQEVVVWASDKLDSSQIIKGQAKRDLEISTKKDPTASIARSSSSDYKI